MLMHPPPGNAYFATGALCACTGILNFGFNCYVVPWLCIIGQKATNFDDNLDRESCCCVCNKGKSPQHLKNWVCG